MTTEKICSACKKSKPELAFPGNGRGGVRASCRDCIAEKNRIRNLPHRLETVVKKAWKTTHSRGGEWTL